MPLFQPSNITPSSFAGVGGGVIDANEPIKITWQVNGNSPMTGFRIRINLSPTETIFFKDKFDSGIVPVNNFYPTDNKGNVKYYTYDPNKTWSDYGIKNGNKYYLSITQYWGNATDDQHTVEQFSKSTFITREKPTCKITTSTGEAEFETIDAVFQDFTAEYHQANKDVVEWVRWRMYENGKLVDDTGVLNTQVLNYEAKNMQSGNNYTLVCTVQTENGVQVTAEKSFLVDYTLSEMSEEYSVNFPDKSSNLLEWGKIEDLESSEITIGVSNDNKYTLSNDKLKLPFGSNITWSKNIFPDWTVAGQFNADILLEQIKNDVPSIVGTVEKAIFSTDNSIFIVGYVGTDSIVASIYNVDNTSQTTQFLQYLRVQTILKEYEEETLTVNVSDISFNASGDRLLVCGRLRGYAKGTMNQLLEEGFCYIYKIENGQITPFKEINLNSAAYSCAMNPNNNFLLVGLERDVYVYSITESGFLQIDTISTTSEVKTISFSNNNKFLLIGGENKLASIYSVEENSLTYIDNLKSAENENYGIDCGIFTDNSEYLITVPYMSVSTEPSKVYCYKIEQDDTIKFVSSLTMPVRNIVGVDRIFSIYYSEKESTIIFCLRGGIFNTVYTNVYLFTNGSFKEVGSSFEETTYGAAGEFSLSPDGTKLARWGGSKESSWVYITSASGIRKQLFSIGNISINNYFGLEVVKNGEVLHFNQSIQASSWSDRAVNADIYFSISKDKAVVSINGFEKTLNFSSESQTEINKIVANGDQELSWLRINAGSETIPQEANNVWSYGTRFLTRFNRNTLDSYQNESERITTDIYRMNKTTGELQKIYPAFIGMRKLRDFSWLPNNKYEYYMYLRQGYKYTHKGAFVPESICRNQPFYLLLETKQDEQYADVYHVLNYWRFGNNFSMGSISNNNTPEFLTNFTPYRMKQPTSRNSKSGVLSSLLSNTVRGIYKDNVSQMEELYNLSSSTNTFFLKDTKGNMYMVAISGAITQTINENSNVSEVKISLPWEEVGSCEGVSIIQIETDENWNNKEINANNV